MDSGSLAHMNYNNSINNHNGRATNGGIGMPGAGFGARGSRLTSKRLSVALPPKVDPISEHQVDSPTPRTSRSHLLAGLRTQKQSGAVPASAPYHQTQHSIDGLAGSKWADQGYSYNQAMPQTATGTNFDHGNQYAIHAARQMYALPEQVLAPPSFYEQGEDMDPNVLQQMQMTSIFLAQRQQQLQQQLASITATANQFQGLNMTGNVSQQRSGHQQSPMTPQTPQSYYSQQQQQMMQSPVEVQPGVYLVYNPAIQGYSYAYDQNANQQAQSALSPSQQNQSPNRFASNSPSSFEHIAPSVSVSPPLADHATQGNQRSFTPPKKASTLPSTLEHVEPLPPPSATAFRRGHKKATSLAINPQTGNVADGMKTASAATFGSQRSVFPPTPMTGTFGPGAARAGEHPLRQPRGPPPLEELKMAPTSQHEGSKNFATRQRRRALDSLAKAGAFRRGFSQSGSNDASPITSDGGELFSLGLHEDSEALTAANSVASSRKMSPIGSEMQEKRNSQGSNSDGGYFGLSSASSSEAEDAGAFKQPPTPATPGGHGLAGAGSGRRMMIGGLLNAAEKRRSFAS